MAQSTGLCSATPRRASRRRADSSKSGSLSIIRPSRSKTTERTDQGMTDCGGMSLLYEAQKRYLELLSPKQCRVSEKGTGLFNSSGLRLFSGRVQESCPLFGQSAASHLAAALFR